MTKLKYFLGACILAGGVLIKLGAPPAPVLLGIAMAGAASWQAHRRSTGLPR
jgi:hypothetical protein